MCSVVGKFFGKLFGLDSPSVKAIKPAPIPAANNAEANATADMEAALRRRRRGAAADILTSPIGIPSRPATRQLGEARP